jgi:hypothetical protein
MNRRYWQKCSMGLFLGATGGRNVKVGCRLSSVAVNINDSFPCAVWFHGKFLRHDAAYILDDSILGMKNV